MSSPTSIKITKEAETALTWLRSQIGGFNLSQAVSQAIITEAVKRGWKE